jgi:hypothetical protein
VMRFVAFAYLYHYLNWFSKTSIINWNRIAMPRAVVIVAIWVFLLATYSNDSRAGVTILMVLSFAHGFLELPLDHQTFFNLYKEMRALAAKRLGRSRESTEVQTEFA